MYLSKYYFNSLKEVPQEAELISHQLMQRSNMIKQTASGIYTWLPLGLRVLRKVEQIVREEMNAAGALEISMPMTQPLELWDESGRSNDYGLELLKFKDRHNRMFCLGPTHEEVITDIVRREIQSYKQLPFNLYQIQTKFRDEIRPRFGIMRAREFLMKDAYSFHTTKKSLQETYELMVQAYTNILTRVGLDFRSVSADSGSIGGQLSHEFHVLADSGEDALAFSDSSTYCANVELAPSLCNIKRPPASAQMEIVHTPNKKTIKAVSDFLKIDQKQCVKLLLVEGTNDNCVALVLRGDHDLNEVKAEKNPLIKTPLTLASPEQALKKLGCDFGSLGPLGIKVPLIVDAHAAALADFCCGANSNDEHCINVNWGRDLPEPQIEDLRMVQHGDPSPDQKGNLVIRRGIEVGHVFQLGTKYSEALNCTIQNKEGKSIIPYMGCYGVGVSRIVAASIEQNNDERGIIWSDNITPFQVHVIAINLQNSELVRSFCEKIDHFCQQHQIAVVIDDRDLRLGNKFADADLIGCPHRLIVGEKGLKNQEIEYQHRSKEEKQSLSLDSWQEQIKSWLKLL